MKYRITTSRPKYEHGLRVGYIEEKFPKVFDSKDEAETFGRKFFEPPISVEKWAVKEE
jgi:hypothetical protein